MATVQEENAYIDLVSPYIVELCEEFGVYTPSAVIAQFCHEPGYGVAPKAKFKVAHNNLTGIKYKEYAPGKSRVDCHNGYFLDGSYEEYKKGELTPISTYWYSFPDVKSGCRGYFEFCFLHTNAYKKCLGITDSFEYLKAIKAAGYATGSDYAEHCYEKVKKHNLIERFDKPLQEKLLGKAKDKPVKTDIEIIPNYGTHLLASSPRRPIKYLVIHYTAGTHSREGKALDEAKYFDSGKAKGSADFIVDDKKIVQYNGDIANQYSQHCGGNKYNTLGGSQYGIVKNSNSIGIEICSSNSLKNADKKANDPSWYFTDEVVENAIKLVKHLMKEYGIVPNNVYRHYDTTGKLCPGIIGWNEDTGNIDKWNDFKQRIGAKVTPVKLPAGYWVEVNFVKLAVRQDASSVSKILGYMKKGDLVYISMLNDTRNWGKFILPNGAEGWIPMKYCNRK